MNSYKELYAFLVREIDTALDLLEHAQANQAADTLQKALHTAEDAVCSLDSFPDQSAE